MSKISELSDGGSLVSSDYLIAVRSGGNVKVRMDQINVDQIDLGDNEFIRLGNSQDLTIVHAATQSIINQAGIGDLLIQKAGSTKLTVNSSGIDVTGTVTADGLTSSGPINLTAGALAAAGNAGLSHRSTDNKVYLQAGTGGFNILDDQQNTHFAIDSAGASTFYGNVGIGNSSPPEMLTIGSTSDTNVRIQFLSSTTGGNTIHFGDGASADAYRGYINYTHSDDALAFAAGGSERMRIDASGNLLVGKTTTALATAGLTLGAAGFASLTRDGAEPLNINRLSSDGNLAVFYKDGTAVGSIGSVSGTDIELNSTLSGSLSAGGTKRFGWNTSGVFFPHTDNANDLGASGSRFKNLYLSGGVYANNASGAFLWNAENAHIAFGTNNTERMRIDSAGNITQTSGDFLYSGGGNWDIKHTGASQNIVFSTTPSGGSATQRMRITSAGNVGIGTSNPTKPLHVESSVTNTNTVLVKNTAGTGVNYGLEIAAGTNATDHALHVTSSSGTSLLRVDGSGNVGVGTSSPTSTQGFTKIFKLEGSSNSSFVVSGGTDECEFAVSASGGWFGTSTNVDQRFVSNNTERMRLDSSGTLLVGKTTNAHTIAGSIVDGLGMVKVTRSDWSLLLNRIGGSNGEVALFQHDSATKGSISVTSSATTFNTSSDQRLKENIVDAPSASDDIDAIQVRSFDWKADGSHQKYGMVAQELLEVAPSSVSQPEDPEEMMGVDYSKLVPMLVKEIQSLRARVAQLES